jgi:hypothetical protein
VPVFLVAIAGLAFIFPWGLRVSAAIFAVGVGSLLLMSALEGGVAGCFILFHCSVPDPYAGMATGFSLLYLGLACLLRGLVHAAIWLARALGNKTRS